MLLALPAVATLTPTTSPAMSDSGPPLFPGLIDASVWRTSSSVSDEDPPLALMVRCSALITPAVTEPWLPSGDPMATTGCPTVRLAEVPNVACGSVVLGTLTTARSSRLSLPTSLATNSWPSGMTTWRPTAPLTTWLLVTR